MDIDTSVFLPKYPNPLPIKNYPLMNPYPYDNFYSYIYHKKEFYDERSDPNEKMPILGSGTLLHHQNIIARFFSSHTIYNSLLLLHEMGTGKSCSAVGAIEQIKKQGGFRGALYLANGRNLIDNFIDEIVHVCTDGRYIPDSYQTLTSVQKNIRKKKAIKDFYHFETFDIFAKKIRSTPSDNIKKEYSNFIIVIDEVHNLRPQKETGDKTQVHRYQAYWRFLHLVQDTCKILLMSGTPMKDSVAEIASVMNLILPKNEQLSDIDSDPESNEFIKQYFDVIIPPNSSTTIINQNILRPNPLGREMLKKAFKGRVSFLRAISSTIKKSFIGSLVGTLQYLTVNLDYMSEFQSEHYLIARQQQDDALLNKSQQASLFVYPDGTYGEEGFNKYIQLINSSTMAATLGRLSNSKKYKFRTTVLGGSLPHLLNPVGTNPDTIIRNIGMYGSKYSEVLRQILIAKTEQKNCFVYCDLVQGSGAILFSLLLELIGYSEGTVNRNAPPGSRYIILTNKTSTDNLSKELIGRFNQPDNMHGDFIQVIIGSRKVSEGFSFKNIQKEFILTPHWNYSETSQAIARGIRYGSHKDLIESGITPTVEIFLQVSIPLEHGTHTPSETTSVDLLMYAMAERKDVSIKSVERIIKEAAFDCALNYRRNSVGQDYSRECDYMECNFDCEGIDMAEIDRLEARDLDYSTYNLYYNSQEIERLITRISQVFQKIFEITFNDLKLACDEELDFNILTALKKMIDNNISITNKYGFLSYIRESNNIYYLIESLLVIPTYSSVYYTINPLVKNNKTYKTITDNLYYKSLPNTIRQIFATYDRSTMMSLLSTLPRDLIEYIIEQSIRAQLLNISINFQSRDMILEHYRSYIHDLGNGYWLSSYLYTSDESLKCAQNPQDISDQWPECSTEIKDQFLKIAMDQKMSFKKRGFDYYGQENPERNEFVDDKEIPLFCIEDITNLVENENMLPPPDVIQINIGKTIDMNTNKWYITNKNDDLAKISKNTKKTVKKLLEANAQVEHLSGISEGTKFKAGVPILLPKDARKFTGGKVCMTWKLPELYDIAIDKLKIPLPEPDIVKKYFRDKKLDYNNMGVLKKFILNKGKISDYDINNSDLAELQRIAYYGSQSKKDLCSILRQFFKNNDLMVESSSCGDTNKKKT